MTRCETDAWHHFQTNGTRLQCKYCGAFRGETILERDLRQSIEKIEETRNA